MNLKHNPKIEIFYDTKKEPFISIVMPIHNQQNIIGSVIESINKNTFFEFELILIFDGCTDNSKQNCLEKIQLVENLCKVTVLTNESGIFETSCDNQGFMLSRSGLIIEIQADMIITTKNFDLLLSKPLLQYPDLIAVSGRCCHRLTDDTGIGKLGRLAELPHQTKETNIIFLSHTCNRGPLILRKSMLVELNYLDEEHYALGDDEHDLFARAWVQKKWRTAFFPIEYESRLEWGSTRKQRRTSVQQYLNKRTANISNGFLFKYKNTIDFPTDEIRKII
jgi:glycosyltransferase involved in cell wall biosynthesis